MEEVKKPTLYSGIQPSGNLTIGNYIGAINNWLKLSDDYNTIYEIADLHALTVRQNPAEFRARALSFFAQYLACGLDPEKSIIYFQSHLPAHAELTWILNCFTYVGEASRMTQFKEKSRKHTDNINMGLMDYPVLMAADILLFQTDLVPTGIDQKQHVELARDIAMRFNSVYSETFKIPEPYIAKAGAKVFSLQNPTAKMSKSDDDPNGSVLIMDAPDVIMRKFKRAVTDSDPDVRYDVVNKPGISNLLTIMSTMTGESIESLENTYRDKGYATFKSAVGEAVIEKLAPIRDRYDQLMKNPAELKAIAAAGLEKAARIAYKTLNKVYKKVGLVQR